MLKKVGWYLFASLSLVIGLYPLYYFFGDRMFGLLSSKSGTLLSNVFWNAGFYTHIIFGGLSLFIGWTQFSIKLRNTNISLHIAIGKMYVISTLLSSTAGIGIGFYATGGIVSSFGFISLGLIWFITTIKAYLAVKNKKIQKHQKLMIYSYAACFAAVTLRIWLPLLIIFIGDFIPAYRIVAWLCWLPNLFVAYLLNKKIGVE